MESSHQTLDISWEAILKVCLAVFIFYLVYLVKDVVIWFLFGLIISVLLDPAIKLLKRFHIHRVLAAIITYLLIFGVLGLLIYFTAPILVDEIKQFSQMIPQYFQETNSIFRALKIESLQSIENFTDTVTNNLEQISLSVFNAIAAFFGGVVSAFFILSIAFFLSLEENGIEKFLKLLTPKKYEESVLAIFEKCEDKVSGWFGTRILACLFVAIFSFVAFIFFDVKYAFILASIVGILNFIPFLGPLIATVLLILLVWVSDGLLKALLVVLAFTLVHQIESNIISPVLTKKFLGVPAILVLISLVVGWEILGFLGAIFSVPVFGIIYEFTKEFLEKNKELN